MTRYRLRPLAVEPEGEGAWAGTLPDGPVLWIGGTGAVVLGVLGDPAAVDDAEPLTAAEVTARIAELVEDLPGDAGTIVASFLEELADAGLLDRLEGDGR